MGISPTQLLIILVIVALVFGTKKLRNIGGDLGDAVKGFKRAMNEDDKKAEPEQASLTSSFSEAGDKVFENLKESEDLNEKDSASFKVKEQGAA